MTLSKSLALAVRSLRATAPAAVASDAIALVTVRALDPSEADAHDVDMKEGADAAPASTAPPPPKRQPVDLVVVLDHSGSMSGDKLELCKKTLAFLVETTLTSEDRLGIVLFDTDVRELIAPTLMDEAGKNACLRLVSGISPGSSTNLCGGILRGLGQLRAIASPSAVSAVIVLTDGMANVGPTGGKLVSEVKRELANFPSTPMRRDSASTTPSSSSSSSSSPSSSSSVPTTTSILSGILSSAASLVSPSSKPTSSAPARPRPSVFCFGYGSDAETDLLHSIASAGDGAYYPVLSVESVPLAFADVVGGITSVCAQNLSLTVTLEGGNGAEFPADAAEHVSYPVEAVSKTKLVIRVKDMYAGESRDLVLKVRVGASPFGDAAAQAVRVGASLTYLDLALDRNETLDAAVEVGRTPGSVIDASAPQDPEVVRHLARVEAVQALKEANAAAERGDRERGKALAARAESRLKEMADCDTDEMLCEAVSDLRMASKAMESESTWRTEGHSRVVAAVSSHAQQRSAKADDYVVQSSGIFADEAAKPMSAFAAPSKKRAMASAAAALGLSKFQGSS